ALIGEFAIDQLDLFQHRVQPVFIDTWVLTQSRQRTALAFEILHNRAPQIRALENVEQIEQGGHGDLMVSDIFAFGKEEQAIEQMLDPEKRANAFVTWIFVKNHATYNPYSSACMHQ